MKIAVFTFSSWAENTYIIYDDTKECVILDPGCSTGAEEQSLVDFIESNALKPVKLVNTHCHIDHVLGNRFVSDTYNLPLIAHKGEQIVLDNMVQVAKMYGTAYTKSPDISIFIKEGEYLTFGDTQLEIYFTPGHSPASVSFFHRPSKQLIAGDVLFKGSIGRTDLPGGNLETLIASIKDKFFPLGDDVIVYNGHGPSTTIGEEKRNNPFLIGV